MNTQDKIRWLKAAASLLTCVDLFLNYIHGQLKQKDATRLSGIQEHVKTAWAEIQTWVIELGGHD